MSRLTWTHQPYETMWKHLLIFISKANVIKLLSGEMKSSRSLIFEKGEALEKKANQIAYAIGQAYEYYRAADTVSISTSPLLYFYGMLSLAKALIIANHQHLLLNDIAYHGLNTRPCNEELEKYTKNENDWKIEQEFLVMRPGVFNWLTRITMDFEFPEYTVFTIKDLLRIDPEIADFYFSLYGEIPQVQYLYDHNEKFDPYHLTICPRTIDKDIFEETFPQFVTDFEAEPNTRHEQALVYHSKPHVTQFPTYFGIYYPLAGGRYLVNGLPYKANEHILWKCQFPELSDYLLMFVLSNCVRYKQEFWGKLIRGEVDGSIGILNLTISNARLRYPNFILNNLYNEMFEYSVAARLM